HKSWLSIYQPAFISTEIDTARSIRLVKNINGFVFYSPKVLFNAERYQSLVDGLVYSSGQLCHVNYPSDKYDRRLTVESTKRRGRARTRKTCPCQERQDENGSQEQ